MTATAEQWNMQGQASEPPSRRHTHHSHPGDTLEDARSVSLPSNPDVQITVGEDEPAKHAVEAEISRIEEVDAGKPIREYFDKWKGGIDTRVPIPSLRGLSVSWLGAFIG
jgi:hypothetical protein